MADLWAQREMAIMRAPVHEKEVADKKLLHDEKTYGVDGKEYKWKQTQEELEISFPERKLSREEARSAKVVMKSRHLSVSLQGEKVFDDDLWESIRTEESTWIVVDGVLVVNLCKVPLDPPELNNWPRCGRTEPHKYDKEYKAKMARREARRKAAADAAAEKAFQEAFAEATAEADAITTEETDKSPPAAAVDLDDMPELEDYVPLAERSPDPAAESKPEGVPAPEESNTGEETPTKALPDEKDEADQLEAAPERRAATTGTKAELERRKREAALKEDGRWKKGTKAEEWERIRHKGLGPQSVAESRRRGEMPAGYPGPT